MLMQFQNSNAQLNEFGTSDQLLQHHTPCRMNYSESVQLARVGVNYKFGY